MKKMLLMSLLAALIFSGSAIASDSQPAEESVQTASQEQQSAPQDNTAETPAEAGQSDK